MEYLNNLLPFLIVGGLFFFMMRNGGCCGGHSHHQNKDKEKVKVRRRVVIRGHILALYFLNKKQGNKHLLKIFVHSLIKIFLYTY